MLAIDPTRQEVFYFGASPGDRRFEFEASKFRLMRLVLMQVRVCAIDGEAE